MTNFEPFKMVTTRNLTKSVVRNATFLLVVSVFTLYSCKKDNRDDGVLSQKEFSALLAEFYLAEARLNTAPIVRDSAMKLFIPFEHSFLKKNNVSNEVLKKTYRYYLDHPDE